VNKSRSGLDGCRCSAAVARFPPFRLRWLQCTIWSIEEREIDPLLQGRRCSTTDGVAPPCLYYLIHFNIFSSKIMEKVIFTGFSENTKNLTTY